MTDAQKHIAYQQAVIAADRYRIWQAGHLAEQQLGFPPCHLTQPAAFRRYHEAYLKLARAILARPN
jgi:hypothetical protein